MSSSPVIQLKVNPAQSLLQYLQKYCVPCPFTVDPQGKSFFFFFSVISCSPWAKFLHLTKLLQMLTLCIYKSELVSPFSPLSHLKTMSCSPLCSYNLLKKEPHRAQCLWILSDQVQTVVTILTNEHKSQLNSLEPVYGYESDILAFCAY